MNEQQTTSARLEYESPSKDPKALRVEHGPDGTVTITVPTRRTGMRYALAVSHGHAIGLLLIPFTWGLFQFFATKKPRAVFRVTRTDLHLLETDDGSLGYHETARSWPQGEIGELRRNRYERGLWMTIVGKNSFNLLEDVPEPMISAVSEALVRARESVGQRVA
jgi:hypothetical protein